MIGFTSRTLAILLLLTAPALASAAEVLIVGDSHTCGAFGPELARLRAEAGDRVTLYCASSSAPRHWVNAPNSEGLRCLTSVNGASLVKCSGTGALPPLATLFAADKYQEIVVALGTNSLAKPAVTPDYLVMAQAATRSGARCRWIGPPHLRPDQAKGFSPKSLKKLEGNLDSFYDSLQSELGGECTIIDSRPVSKLGAPAGATTDGVHRGVAAGKAWANALAGEI